MTRRHKTRSYELSVSRSHNDLLRSSNSVSPHRLQPAANFPTITVKIVEPIDPPVDYPLGGRMMFRNFFAFHLFICRKIFESFLKFVMLNYFPFFCRV